MLTFSRKRGDIMGMRMPSGYGSVVKQSGKRRKPYAVRTSRIIEYLDVYIETPNDEVLRNFKRLKFRYKNNKGYWSAIATDPVRKYAESLRKEGIEVKVAYRQSYVFHAYFEKPELAYSYLAELNNGNTVKEHVKYSEVPTFAEMYDKWKKYRQSLKKGIAANTLRNYGIAFNHLAPLHTKKFVSIRANELQEVLNSYNHKSSSTISNMRSVLKGMYSYAIMNGYAETDATTHLIYEWTDSETEIHTPYTDEEIKNLWDNLYEINNVDILLILIYTGLRPSELLNILTENVFLDEQYMIGGMKTENGKDRIIPIADKILPLIKARYDSSRKYLINNRYGNHYSYGSYVSSNFNTVINRLGMQHIPHDGRHTFATLMDRAGANEVCTKLIMGHSMRNDITKGTYTHKTVEDLLKEVNKI